jgi:exodeoxyribonuclease-3
MTTEAWPLKIATFNINNIDKRLNNLTAWLGRAQPDVVCLQELKVEQRTFPASTLRDLGPPSGETPTRTSYNAVWNDGIAPLISTRSPLSTR